ncbi:hypothetical protein BGZ94_009181 [Podila epigama]|nr:hypothetical protein BGZ94_009181 [Podila epigama]
MRPDPHKQAASRKYQQKLKSKGASTGSGPGPGSASASASGSGSAPASGNAASRGGASHRGGTRGGSRGRGGYGRSNHSHQDDKDNDDDGESEDGTPRKSYARRKITSNADRYNEPEPAMTEAEELEQGIDRQTMAFRELLDDADQKKTFDPAAYFRFKSEKDVESQDAAEETQQARKLLEVKLADTEKGLMTLSIKDRLHLQESDAKLLEQDVLGKVSFSTGKPIVPKMIRGQAASDILIKPGATALSSVGGAPAKSSGGYSAAVSSADANSRQAMQESLDDDLDELLDITKTYGKAKAAVSSSVPVSTPKLPLTLRANNPQTRAPGGALPVTPGASAGTTGRAVRKTLPPLKKKGPPTPSPATKKTTDKDEDWLDSVLGN